MKLGKYKIQDGILVLVMISRAKYSKDGFIEEVYLDRVELPKTDEAEELYDELKNPLNRFEEKRQQIFQKSKIYYAIAAIITFIVGLAFYFNSAHIKLPVMVIVTLIVGILSIWLAMYPLSSFKKRFKTDLIHIILDSRGIEAQISLNKIIKTSVFEDSQLFSRTNHYSGRNLAEGIHNGVQFSVSELEAYKRVKRGKKYHDTLKFAGLFFVGQVPIKGKGDILIASRDFTRESDGRFSDGDFNTLHPEFDQHFLVNYSDFDLASAVLSEQFMNSLLRFKLKHRWPFAMRITDRRVYIAINEELDFFKVGYTEKLSSKPVFNRLYEDATFYEELIKILNDINTSS